MDEKRHSTLVAVPGERCNIGNVCVLGRGQARLGLNKSLSSRSEVLVLFERDPNRVSPCWNIKRNHCRSSVEIKGGIDWESKNVRQLTPKIGSLQTQSEALMLRLQNGSFALKSRYFKGVAPCYVPPVLLILDLGCGQLVLRCLQLLLVDQYVVVELTDLQCNRILGLIELCLGDEQILFCGNVRLVDAKQLSKRLL